MRISPLSATNGVSDTDPAATFTQAARDLETLGIAYLHVIEPCVNGTLSTPATAESPKLASGYFRPMFSGAIIAAGGHPARAGTGRIGRQEAVLIAYGRPFTANPDLPARFRRNAALARSQRSTFCGGGAAGYTDYPALGMPGQRDRPRCQAVTGQALTGGTRADHGRADSSWPASRNSVASSPYRPRKCTPTGRPDPFHDNGTDIAGLPVMLATTPA